MIRIVERKLGRERAYGLAWSDELIEIDPRQGPRDYLGTVIHEALHQVYPENSESEVARATATLTRLLWGLGYRRTRKGWLAGGGSNLRLRVLPFPALRTEASARKSAPARRGAKESRGRVRIQRT